MTTDRTGESADKQPAHRRADKAARDPAILIARIPIGAARSGHPGKQANSLLAGKIQGVFVGEASQAQANAPNSSSIASRYGEVPYATEQGKFAG